MGFVAILTLLLAGKTFGQAVPDCRCTSNDVTSVTAALTKDAQGTPLTSTGCSGTTETAYLTFTFTTNANQRPGAYGEVIYTLNGGPQKVTSQCFPYVYSGSTIKLSLPVEYHCGDDIEIVGMIFAWGTGNGQSAANQFCQVAHSMCDNVRPHCYQPKETLAVGTSLIPGFDVTKSCEGVANGGTPAVTINGKATGGTEPYTFDWDLDNDGTWDILGEQTVMPLLATGTHSVSVRVTDALGEVATYNQSVLIESCINLPVAYAYIKASPASEQGVEVEWQTTSEENSSYFEVERSANGQNFRKVSEAISEPFRTAGNGLKTYRFTDVHAPAGLSYYRLRQVDLDGTKNYSKILSVSMSEGGKGKLVKISPNPVQDRVKIEILSAPKGDFSVEVIDMAGRSLRSVNGVNRANGFQYEFDTHALPTGLYLLSIRVEDQYYVRRIVK
ncbi:hypothetical protein GCM10023091_43370 [Ravibacter arvi]|uniref:Secretion system C-terminal sorting domain-containing protein n=1 Tax=Ravibacter arvi TaxID=2051041 RepID=A0ABP8MDV4_9BACT